MIKFPDEREIGRSSATEEASALASPTALIPSESPSGTDGQTGLSIRPFWMRRGAASGAAGVSTVRAAS